MEGRKYGFENLHKTQLIGEVWFWRVLGCNQERKNRLFENQIL